MILRNKFLNLGRRQDPTDVKQYLDVSESCLDISIETSLLYLLQLKQFGSLHEMFELEKPFWHVMGFAPL